MKSIKVGITEWTAFLTPAAVFGLVVSSATAAVVNHCDEASLRAAAGDGGTVTFACDGTIALATTLNITKNTVLDAAGHQVTISGAGLVRVLSVAANAELELKGLTIANGYAAEQAGGLLNLGTVTLRQCVFSNHAARITSGTPTAAGILNDGTLLLAHCTFIKNHVTAFVSALSAGAILNRGTLGGSGSTFIDGFSPFGSGGIYTIGAMAGLTNCTFYENLGRGGHLFNGNVDLARRLSVVHCTFAGQGAVGGFISSSTWIANSLFTSDGSVTDGGGNISLPFDLGLAPLSDNGGPTLTMALLPDSAAIDQGDPSYSVAVDQRGVSRPVGARCDVGAFESTLPPSPTVIEFATAALSANEADATVTIPVNRSGNLGPTVSASFSVVAGSAQAGWDYVATNGTVTFGLGQTSSAIVLTLIKDVVPEPDETVELLLSSPGGGASLGSQTSTVLTLHDDDPAQPGTLAFRIADYSVSEGIGELLIQVMRTGGTNGPVTVNFAAVDGTALAGADYAAANGTLAFGDTETTKTIRLRILPDTVPEGTESLKMSLSGAAGGALLGTPSTIAVNLVDGAHSIATCDESGLRAAVASGGRVTLMCDGTIMLTSALVVGTATQIDASGHDVVLSGGGVTRLFVVNPGVELSLTHLVLADGCSRGTNGDLAQPGGTGEGGALYNNGGAVRLADCTFRENKAQGGDGGNVEQFVTQAGGGGVGRGGAICTVNGDVRATASRFEQNLALGGTAGISPRGSGSGGNASAGAIYNEDGMILLEHCRFWSNGVVAGLGTRSGAVGVFDGTAAGGAVETQEGETRLFDTEVNGNHCSSRNLNAARGGAICHSGGVLELQRCHVTSNRALAGRGIVVFSPAGLRGGLAYGGGLAIGSGQVVIQDSTLDHNWAVGGAEPVGWVPGGAEPAGSAYGGAVYNAASVVSFLNSTLAANEARSGSARASFPSLQGTALGGALFNDGGSVLMQHVTIARNSARADGGSPYDVSMGGGLTSFNGPLTLLASIVARGTAGTNCVGNIVDAGGNISDDSSCPFHAPGSQNNTDPLLGPLAYYGGPVPTVALLEGSPAIDPIPGDCPSTDQRGRTRPFGAACDSGAFESSEPWSLLGHIDGYRNPAGGMTISAGGQHVPVDLAGNYAIGGFSSGSYTILPAAADAVFVQSNRVVSVGPDRVGLDFYSFRSNALTTFPRVASNARLAFAGHAGDSYRVLTGTNLIEWLAVRTNTIPASGVAEWIEPLTEEVQQFFRAVRP